MEDNLHQEPPDVTIISKRKTMLENGIPHYRVRIGDPSGCEYSLEAFGEEAGALESEVRRLKEQGGASPKIFVNGDGANHGSPAAAGCTNQPKSTGLAHR